MTPEQETVLIIRGTIAGMPEEHQKKIMQAHAKLNDMIREDPLTALAIALIGAEIAAL